MVVIVIIVLFWFCPHEPLEVLSIHVLHYETEKKQKPIVIALNSWEGLDCFVQVQYFDESVMPHLWRRFMVK